MSYIKLFNSLDKFLLSNIGCFIDVKYSFSIEHQKVNLSKQEESKGVYTLSNDEYLWNIQENGLCMDIYSQIKNSNFLFNSKHAVAHPDSQLSLVLSITSDKNKIKTFKTLFTFKNQNESLVHKNDIEIPKDIYKGTLEFKVFLVLSNKGQGTNPNILNESGIILGEIESWKVKTDGNASNFPIMFFADKKEPLWRLQCTYKDPESDEFSENIRIDFNTAHKDFKFLDYKSEFYSERLANEIIKQCMQTIFIDLFEKDYFRTTIDDIGQDSVLQAAYYLVETHDIKVDSISNIIQSLNDFFERS